MLSLSRFKDNLLQVFRVMIATGAYIDVAYKGRLYRVHIEDLNTRAVIPRRKRSNLQNKIQAGDCPACGKLLVNGVCMNAKSHLPAAS